VVAAAARRHDFYQEGLTGLRALAATWVMLFHVNSFAGPRAIELRLGSFAVEVHPLITCGWVGVDLFFVLSGFLLATHLLQSLSRPTPGIYRRYLAARVRRVFPAYWAQLAILLGVAVIAAGSLPAWAKYLPLHIPMLHFVSESASFAINNVYWTLPIEFAFYLCLPFIARVLARAERRERSKWLTLALLYAGSLVLVWAYRYATWRLFAESPVNIIVWATAQLPGSFDQFMAGVAAATALRWWRRDGLFLDSARTGGLSSGLAIVGLGGVVGMIYFIDAIYLEYWHGHPALFFWHSATSAFVALAVLGIALGGPLTRALFENRVAVWLGTISYSIYLWHYPIALWLKPALDGMGAGLASWVLVAVPLTIAVAAASYYALERPFLARAPQPDSPAGLGSGARGQ
jgi:peptidoglycan/LPS O-acetylase OafA/YrhL